PPLGARHGYEFDSRRDTLMNFLVLPPEINSARMYLGAGPGSMLEAAAAWDGLAGELGSAATPFGAGTSGPGGRGAGGAGARGGGGGDGRRGRAIRGVAFRGGVPGARRGRAGAGGGVGV